MMLTGISLMMMMSMLMVMHDNDGYSVVYADAGVGYDDGGNVADDAGVDMGDYEGEHGDGVC